MLKPHELRSLALYKFFFQDMENSESSEGMWSFLRAKFTNYLPRPSKYSSLITRPGFGESAERTYVKENRIKTVKDLFLNRSLHPNDIIVLGSDHNVLHEAIILNKREIFRLCLLYGADPNKPDSLGTPPILKAAALGRLEMIKDLLAKGADPLFVDKKGKTALDKAILFEQFETVEFLEDLYSNINKNNLHYETKNSK
eukprot:TRINITY_DN2661_c0_g1_i5.p1 TRINITY_DN2661_c0_g1~~TRINITY_DN2661_c0_g1_i5.p1  ORF type:complete len:199 (+),score=26.98 TRINITY_DN2661_c0_g1_i5:150-746(+)